MPTFSGSCHCGAITFAIDADAMERDLYRCNCSLCIKKAIIMKPVRREDFRLTGGEAALSAYKWNKQIAEHFFCSLCGVYTHHKRRSDPSQISVNFGCLNNAIIPPEHEIGLVNGAELE